MSDLKPSDFPMLRQIAEHATDVIWMADLEGRFTFISPSVQHLQGYSPDELIGKRITDILTPESAARLDERTRRGMASPPPNVRLGATVTVDAVHANGTVIPVETRATLTFDENGTPSCLVGITRDISERDSLQLEQAQHIRHLEYLSRTALEFAALPPTAGLYEHIAKKLYEIVGDALVGVHSFDAETSSFTCRAVEGIGALASGIMKLIGRHPVGLEITVPRDYPDRLVSGELVRLGDGCAALAEGQVPGPVCAAIDKLMGIKGAYSVGMVRSGRVFGSATILPRVADGTFDTKLLEAFAVQASVALQRWSVEIALVESEERYRRLVSTMPDAVVILQDGLHKYVNPAFIEKFGYTQEDVDAGLSFMDLVREEDTPAVRRQYDARLAGKPVPRNFRLDLVAKDGTAIPCETSAALIQFDGRAADLVFIRDVTERARAERQRAELEEQLRQAQKLEAIGTLAGGVAHDFNNLLTGVLGYADLLLHDHGDMPDVRRAAEVITNAAVRASNLTKQLLGFARKGKLQDVPVDVHALIADVTSILFRTLDKRIVVHQRYGTPEATTRGDPVQLEQVFMNLAVNARDAMPEGGDLTFETGTRVLAADEEILDGRPAPGQYVTITVRDTGTGIPDDIRDRILEPFFTTKDPGRGSGLGLSTVYGIVHNHGGWVSIESEVGTGTAVTAHLPHCSEPASTPQPTEPAPAASATGTVLVVDDEESVRSILKDMLRSIGYEAVLAANGREAVEYVRDHPGSADAVILDITMPVMDGPECFAELKKLDPDVRVVISTGHALDGVAIAMLEDGARAFVGKPYAREKLAEALASALAR